MRAWIVLAAVSAGVLLSACSAQNSGPVVVTTTVTAPPPPQLPLLPSRIPMGGPDATTQMSKVDKPVAKFPSTTQAVWITGYDDASNMLEFKLIQRGAGGSGNDHYALAPEDTSEHRLPFADNPKVLSASIVCRSEGPTVGDGGRGTKPCTKDEMLANVKQGLLPLAEIKVDGTQHITAVTELYSP